MLLDTGLWYLSEDSVLEHLFHSRIEKQDSHFSEENLDDNQQNFVVRMYQEGVHPTTIANIMTSILNEKGLNGQFLPSAMKNMTRRMQNAIDKLEGIVSSDYTVAEKSIVKLNVYVLVILCHPMFFIILTVSSIFCIGKTEAT